MMLHTDTRIMVMRDMQCTETGEADLTGTSKSVYRAGNGG